MKIHRMIVSAAVLALCALASLAQSGAVVASGTFHGAAHKASVPSRTDLAKYPSVAIFRERFHANFGTAPLEK
jgi:hypothetical protein